MNTLCCSHCFMNYTENTNETMKHKHTHTNTHSCQPMKVWHDTVKSYDHTNLYMLGSSQMFSTSVWEKWLFYITTTTTYYNYKQELWLVNRNLVGPELSSWHDATSFIIQQTFTDIIISLSADIVVSGLVLGSILVHTEYRCIFLLWYEFLICCHTSEFDYTTFRTLRCVTPSQTGPFSVLCFWTGMVWQWGEVRVNSRALVLCYSEDW